MTGKQGTSPESIVREIRRQTRRKFTAEEGWGWCDKAKKGKGPLTSGRSRRIY